MYWGSIKWCIITKWIFIDRYISFAGLFEIKFFKSVIDLIRLGWRNVVGETQNLQNFKEFKKVSCILWNYSLWVFRNKKNILITSIFLKSFTCIIAEDFVPYVCY